MLRRKAPYTITLTAILLALLEPVLALSDAPRFLCMFLLLACFRSPLWLPSLLSNGRMARA